MSTRGLQQLAGRAAASSDFRHSLLENPRVELLCEFDLIACETAAVLAIRAETLQELVFKSNNSCARRNRTVLRQPGFGARVRPRPKGRERCDREGVWRRGTIHLPTPPFVLRRRN